MNLVDTLSTYLPGLIKVHCGFDENLYRRVGFGGRACCVGDGYLEDYGLEFRGLEDCRRGLA